LQEFFDEGSVSLDIQVGHARAQRERWHRWISWDAIRSSLALNGFVSEREQIMLDVHYGFLSGFTHATNAGYLDVFGMPGSITGDGEDHFAEELVSLYVVTIAARELRLLCRMEDRNPPLAIVGRRELEHDLATAESAADYLWFLDGKPQRYDIVTELNRRVFATFRDNGELVRPAPGSHEELEPGEVRYYTNPMKRLRDMHRSFTEMLSHIPYVSPWRNPGRY
jgi:hypothetical protein